MMKSDQGSGYAASIPLRGDAVLAPLQVMYRWEPLTQAQRDQAAAQGLSGATGQLVVARCGLAPRWWIAV